MNIRYPIYEGVYRILTPKARLFFLQSSIAGCQSRQGPLALATGKSSSPTSLESVFPVASLSGLTVNPVAEK